jgi:hypothetical protein
LNGSRLAALSFEHAPGHPPGTLHPTTHLAHCTSARTEIDVPVTALDHCRCWAPTAGSGTAPTSALKIAAPIAAPTAAPTAGSGPERGYPSLRKLAARGGADGQCVFIALARCWPGSPNDLIDSRFVGCKGAGDNGGGDAVVTVGGRRSVASDADQGNFGIRTARRSTASTLSRS